MLWDDSFSGPCFLILSNLGLIFDWKAMCYIISLSMKQKSKMLSVGSKFKFYIIWLFSRNLRKKEAFHNFIIPESKKGLSYIALKNITIRMRRKKNTSQIKF